MTAHDIIVKPMLSEKSYDGITKKVYTFVVHPSATKTDIKLAIEELFEVKVRKVNTANVSGKMKRMGRTQGMTSDFKKAIVSLTDESKPIAFFESLS